MLPSATPTDEFSSAGIGASPPASPPASQPIQSSPVIVDNHQRYDSCSPISGYCNTTNSTDDSLTQLSAFTSLSSTLVGPI